MVALGAIGLEGKMNALSKIKDFSSALDTGDCNLSELGAPTGRLNWRARVWLDLMRVIGWPELQDRTVAQARDDLRLLIAATSIWQPIAHARDASIPGPAGDIPIRIYTPLIGTKPRPLLVWFHGGGFVLGDLTMADPTCRALANRSGAVVISVDYRLAPEHGCLAASDDAYAAVLWAMQNASGLGCDSTRVAVGGESAGATLSALVSQRCRDDGHPTPALQVLVYPCTDCSGTLSNRDPEVAHLLTWEAIDWFAERCFASLDSADVRISPFFAKDLRGLPPALLITGECDLLCTDGEAYGRRLQEAGVPVEHHRYAGQIHGFFTMDLLFPEARSAQRNVAGRLQALPAQGHRRAATLPSKPIVASRRLTLFDALFELAVRTPPILAGQIIATLLQYKLDRVLRGARD